MSLSVGRNNPCPCGSGAKSKKCCEGAPTRELAAIPSDLPLTLNAKEASARIGVAYETLLKALGNGEWPGSATLEVIPGMQGRRRWVVGAADLVRAASDLGLAVRPLPARGEKPLRRTRSAGFILTPPVFAAAMEFAARGEPGADSLDAVADCFGLQIEALASAIGEDSQELIELSAAWKQRVGRVGAYREVRLAGLDVDHWALLRLEAAAVRAGVPAPYLVTALLERDLTSPEPETVTVQLPQGVALAAALFAGGDDGASVARFLETAVQERLIAYFEGLPQTIEFERRYSDEPADEAGADEIPF